MLVYGANNITLTTDGDFKVVIRWQTEMNLC